MLGLGLLVRAEGPGTAPAQTAQDFVLLSRAEFQELNRRCDRVLIDMVILNDVNKRLSFNLDKMTKELDETEAKLAAETARADKAEVRANAAEAMLTPEQKAKLPQ
jgi:hypothetical protein